MGVEWLLDRPEQMCCSQHASRVVSVTFLHPKHNSKTNEAFLFRFCVQTESMLFFPSCPMSSEGLVMLCSNEQLTCRRPVRVSLGIILSRRACILVYS